MVAGTVAKKESRAAADCLARLLLCWRVAQFFWYNPNSEIILTGERVEVFIPTPDDICPYKGLRFFDVEDAPYFYGREALTEKLIERVQVGKGNFLAVLGVSGSGKSSLLRAGLMYQLQQERRLPGTEQWKIRIFTPGEQPLERLATAFLDEEVTDIERAGQLREAEEAISQGATGLARLIKASKSPRTVLIVDQFEEVFTVCRSLPERQQFISGLLGALKQTGDKLCLIFAMRDDFLGKCAAYRELADLIQANLVMVTPMNAQELRLAIVEPATKLGRKVEENLISAILKDLGVEVQSSSEGEQISEPEPGMLPLLEYTLEQLWQRQTLNWLNLYSYNQLGGVQKTLENLAEQAYKELSVEEQRVADQIFIKLTQLGEGTPDTRKQVPQGDLVAQPQSADLVERVIQKLAQAKLIVTSEQRKGQEKVAVVDVAHEALIRHWSRLRELLDNNREAIRIERKIQTAAEEWWDKGKSKDYLLTGLRLGEAEKFLQDNGDIVPLSRLAQNFVQKSIKHRQTSRLLLTLGGTISVTVLTFAGIAGVQWQGTERQRQIVVAYRLANQAELTREQQGVMQPNSVLHSLLLAVESMKRFPSVDAEISLRRGLALLPQRIEQMKHQDDVQAVAFSSDGKYLVTAAWDKTVRLWDVATGEEVTRLTHEKEVNDVAFSSDGKYLVTAAWDKTVRLWDVATSQEAARLTYEKEVNDVAFSPDGKYLAMAIGDKTLRIWDVKKRQEVARLNHEKEVNDVAFSPDGKYLATASDKIVHFWNTNSYSEMKHITLTSNVLAIAFYPNSKYLATTNTDWQNTVQVGEIATGKLTTVIPYNGSVKAIDFSPDGRHLATASADTTARIWDLETRQQIRHIKHESDVQAVAFSPNSQYLATASADTTTKMWKVNTGGAVARMVHKGIALSREVRAIAFSPDNKYLATGSRDATASVWEVTTGKEIARMVSESDVWAIAFSPDGKYLATASFDRTARVWEAQTGKEIIRVVHKDTVWAAAFSPDGRYLVTASSDKTARIADLVTKQEVQSIEHDSEVRIAAFSPNGKYLVTQSATKAHVWNATTGQEVAHTEYKSINSVQFSPDSKYLVTAGNTTNIDGNIRVLEMPSGREVLRINQKNVPWTVSFSPNGKYLAIANLNETIQVWEIPTGKEVARMQSERAGERVGREAIFTPDSQYLITTSSWDNTAQIWEAATGQEVGRITPEGTLRVVTISPNGQYIATAGLEGDVWVWLWRSEDLIDQACWHIERNFTLEEWKEYLGNEPYRKTCPELP